MKSQLSIITLSRDSKSNNIRFTTNIIIERVREVSPIIDNFGNTKQQLIDEAKSPWILILDDDEYVSDELAKEIEEVIRHPKAHINAYRIPFRNHFLGKPLIQEAEQYAKIRLFRNGYGRVGSALVHEEVEVKGAVGDLKGKINHYSYRSIPQVFGKFTDYARRLAKEMHAKGEKVTLKKLFMYGPHMFYARFFRSGGYKDGINGFLLSLLFAYMESASYWFLAFGWYNRSGEE